MSHSVPPSQFKRAERIAVDLPVFVSSVLVSAMEASLANLTEHGALVVGATLPKGSSCQIEYNGQVVYGTVMWAEEDRFGVRFPIPLQDGPLYNQFKQAKVAHRARSQITASPIVPLMAMRAATGFGRRGL